MEYETITNQDIIGARRNTYLYNTEYQFCVNSPTTCGSNTIRLDKQKYFILLNNANIVVIFSTTTNVDFLSGVLDWYVDGTFEYSPNYFLPFGLKISLISA